MKLSEMHKQKPSSTAETQKSLNEKYEELKDCSGDELMSKLIKEVQSQKANGSFDYQGLRNSIEKIKMYLPNQTYENMIRIIENFKWTQTKLTADF